MNDNCRLIKALATAGPTPAPLYPCCTAALVAQHDPNEPENVWLCPFEERELGLTVPGPETT